MICITDGYTSTSTQTTSASTKTTKTTRATQSTTKTKTTWPTPYSTVLPETTFDYDEDVGLTVPTGIETFTVSLGKIS